MHGIVGYGSYVPRFRIKAEDIANQWGADAAAYKRGLLLEEKTVPGPDEDTITISVDGSTFQDDSGADPLVSCRCGDARGYGVIEIKGRILATPGLELPIE